MHCTSENWVFSFKKNLFFYFVSSLICFCQMFYASNSYYLLCILITVLDSSYFDHLLGQIIWEISAQNHEYRYFDERYCLERRKNHRKSIIRKCFKILHSKSSFFIIFYLLSMYSLYKKKRSFATYTILRILLPLLLHLQIIFFYLSRRI